MKCNNPSKWSGERFWIEVVENELYPPKTRTFMQGVEYLVASEDFSDKVILDYACGIGQVGRMLKERGADVVGIDVSEKLLQVARKYIKVQNADAKNLPFEENTFDYVLAFMVLHVIDDVDKALSEIHRVLKPNGKLYFGIVNPKSEKWDLQKGTSYIDRKTYGQIEDRSWVFNLIDGRRFDEHYIHRPWRWYRRHLLKLFQIKNVFEFPNDNTICIDKKYARNEFLFGELYLR